jgi:hypothetical protein
MIRCLLFHSKAGVLQRCRQDFRRTVRSGMLEHHFLTGTIAFILAPSESYAAHERKPWILN